MDRWGQAAIAKTWRQLTRQAGPPRVLRARCNLPIKILTLVHVVATNWNLRRPLEDAIREQMWTSSSAKLAVTSIPIPTKTISDTKTISGPASGRLSFLFGSVYRNKASRRYVGPNWLRVVFGRGSSHFNFCHLNCCSPSLV